MIILIVVLKFEKCYIQLCPLGLATLEYRKIYHNLKLI